MDGKIRKSFRLSPRTMALVDKLATLHDATQTRIIEEAIREKAKREKVQEDNEGRTTALLSEPTLSKIWDTPEEDSAWQHL